MFDASEQPELRDAEFRMMTELLRKHCGLHFLPFADRPG
jgi:hypothetical protein